MRVLHVVPSYLPAVRYGGPVIATHALCAALARQGCDVTVFTTNVDGPNESPVPLEAPVEMDGVKVCYFAVPWLRRLYRSPAMGRALDRHCTDFHLLHLHSVFLWPTWAAAQAARKSAVPYLVAPRGMLVKELIARKSTLAKRAWIALIEARNLRRAAGIHVTSAVEASELRRFAFTLPPLYEIPNGVDPEGQSHERAALPAPAAELFAGGKPVVLFLGRINWKKGLDRLIPAMARLPQAGLLVAGNDDEGYTSRLMSLARTCGVEERVRFCGPVYGAAKAALFRKATVFALPSYSENFGNVVLEAMLEGCPVVVTPEVGAASIVQQSGAGIVSPGNSECLADSVGRLLADGATRAEMGRRGRRAVQEQYTWDAVAARMSEVYRQVAVRRGALPA
jgi:glycosyltransferase involved in cell wall biosynthesis